MNVDPRLEEVIDCLYRVAVKAVIIRGDRVLLTRDDTDTGWTFPGGGVDVGENLEEAMVRELCEEIGVNKSDIVLRNRLPTSIGHIKNSIPRCNIHFLVELVSGDVKPTQEIVAMEWVKISQLDNTTLDPSAGDKNDFIAVITRAQTA